jgi:hypothetical protein
LLRYQRWRSNSRDAREADLDSLGRIVPMDNRSQFLSDSFAGAKKYNLQGVLYFDASGWMLGSAAISTLRASL